MKLGGKLKPPVALDISSEVITPEDLSNQIAVEFNKNINENTQNIKKIDDYGKNVLNNVMKDLKEYIDIPR